MGFLIGITEPVLWIYASSVENAWKMKNLERLLVLKFIEYFQINKMETKNLMFGKTLRDCYGKKELMELRQEWLILLALVLQPALPKMDMNWS